MNPCPVELIGCGALAEMVYGPALAHLERAGRVRVVALVDPNASRRNQLAKFFPSANTVECVENLPPTSGGLAVIASPPVVHAAQAAILLAAGRHVLCEKPLATSVAEAETMIAAARAAGRLLAAGMMRRFYPAAQALPENLRAGLLGETVRLEIAEGGRFSWNAASPKFFEHANGGVLYDLGSHVLDLLCHWFGEPAASDVLHDALGGANTNILLTARWASGLEARVRLSWDTPLETGWRIITTRGQWRWDGSPDGPLVSRGTGARWWLHAMPRATAQAPAAAPAGSGYHCAFVRQLDNVLGAMAGNQTLLAPAEDVLPSLRWLENARRHAQFLPQPWLSVEEQKQAEQFFKI